MLLQKRGGQRRICKRWVDCHGVGLVRGLGRSGHILLHACLERELITGSGEGKNGSYCILCGSKTKRG